MHTLSLGSKAWSTSQIYCPQFPAVHCEGEDIEKKKVWEKKTVTLGGNRIYFDHDYSERMMQQHNANSNIKKILESEKASAFRHLKKMHIHWASSVKT